MNIEVAAARFQQALDDRTWRREQIHASRPIAERIKEEKLRLIWKGTYILALFETIAELWNTEVKFGYNRMWIRRPDGHRVTARIDWTPGIVSCYKDDIAGGDIYINDKIVDVDGTLDDLVFMQLTTPSGKYN